MLDDSKIYYSLRDVSIVPAEISEINSRSECCPFVSDITGKEANNYFPLITAPMSTVIDVDNYKVFQENKINPIIPRSVIITVRLELCKSIFCAFSLSEIQECFLDDDFKADKFYVLCDIANGHMQKEINILKELKLKYGKSVVKTMGGNIANPNTYRYYNEAFVDYVRLGIGGSSVCLTSSNAAVHTPMASLISETVKIKQEIQGTTKIIADGGLSSFADIIKALAIGADYCMIGSILAKSLESAGKIYKRKGDVRYIVDDKTKITKEDLKNEEYYKHHYGMSTKEAQKSILGLTLDKLKNRKIKTSEGKSEEIRIEYTLAGWCENFESYLRSAMSYCNSYFLNGQFSKRARVIINSSTASSLINDK